MIEADGKNDIENLTESVSIEFAPLYAKHGNGQLINEFAGMSKPDWWDLRANLKPMSEYEQVHSNKQ